MSKTGLTDDDAWLARRRVETFTALELQAMEFPPLQWVVPGYVVEGLTLLAGKPKIGKSWMTLDWALAVAYGGMAFGSVQCEAGDVLYCALEDNHRRLQRRVGQLLPHCEWPDRVSFTMKTPRLDAGAIDKFRDWTLKAEKPRLIVIDTFKQIKPPRQRQDSNYDHDYDALAPLQDLAGELGLGIVAVHHTRKQESDDPLDTISGTTGLTGAVDTAIVLGRDSQGTTLYGRGRDIDDIETAIAFDKTTGRWSILGDANEVRQSDARKAITAALRDATTPLGPKEVADLTSVGEGTVRHLLLKMVASGTIIKAARGKYLAA